MRLLLLLLLLIPLQLSDEVFMARSINAAGEALIRRYEGCRLTPYKDSNGLWTVGYGHKILASDGINPGDQITQAQAEVLLQSDVLKNAAWLEEDLEGIEVNDNEFSALLSLEFNIGIGRFDDSTLLEYVEDGQMKAAADQFLLWRMAGGKVQPGLVARRKAERDLFLTPVEDPATHNID